MPTDIFHFLLWFSSVPVPYVCLSHKVPASLSDALSLALIECILRVSTYTIFCPYLLIAHSLYLACRSCLLGTVKSISLALIRCILRPAIHVC